VDLVQCSRMEDGQETICHREGFLIPGVKSRGGSRDGMPRFGEKGRHWSQTLSKREPVGGGNES